ncbi:MAG: LysE family translocator [Chitinophagaceae bacterium]|nr:LysE family translocator [Rubrivivax sp.]
MPGPGEWAVFMTAVFVLNATPGVDFLLTVSRTLQHGARAGLAAALGIAAGCVAHVMAAAFGLAALLALYPAALRIIQWAGAAYLAWLGLGLLRQAWRGSSMAPNAATRADADDGAAARLRAPSAAWPHFRVGLLTNLLNPKVALFTLAFLPQFVPVASPNPTVSFLLLGAAMVLQGLLFLFALVGLAALLTRWQTSGAGRRVLQGMAGLLFVALALRLLGPRPAIA